jgi:hypothetical protein
MKCKSNIIQSERRICTSGGDNQKSKRNISLPIFGVECLKKHKTLQNKLKLKFGNAYEDNDLKYSHATTLLLLDENPKVVSEQLRHTQRRDHIKYV